MKPRNCSSGGAPDSAHGRDGLAERAELLAQNGEVQRGLAAEVVVEHRLVDAGAAGDAIDLGAVEAAGGELLERGRRESAAWWACRPAVGAPCAVILTR